MKTNEQLAQQICNCQACFGYNDVLKRCKSAYTCSIYARAIDMAEEKDNLFKTELDRLRNRFQGEESHRAYFATETLNELYNNLFQNVIEPL